MSTAPPYVGAGVPSGYRQMVYPFLVTRRWLGLLVVAVLVATGCVLMGVWQVARLADRHERNDLLDRNLTIAPKPVEQVLAVGQDPAEDAQFLRVRARGTFDLDRQLVVRTRPYEGQVGFYVLTPLLTPAGTALLVNRGWVPPGPDAAVLPDVPRPPSGTVTVTARVRRSEPASTTGTPPPGQVTRIDVPGIAATLPYEVYGGYGDLVALRPDPADAPALLPAPEPSEGPHLAYAFQWFLFAGLALGGYVVLARREAADRRAVTDVVGARA